MNDEECSFVVKNFKQILNSLFFNNSRNELHKYDPDSQTLPTFHNSGERS